MVSKHHATVLTSTPSGTVPPCDAPVSTAGCDPCEGTPTSLAASGVNASMGARSNSLPRHKCEEKILSVTAAMGVGSALTSAPGPRRTFARGHHGVVRVWSVSELMTAVASRRSNCCPHLMFHDRWCTGEHAVVVSVAPVAREVAMVRGGNKPTVHVPNTAPPVVHVSHSACWEWTDAVVPAKVVPKRKQKGR